MNREELNTIIIESICEAIKTIDGEQATQIISEDLSFEIDSVVGVNLICILENKLGISLPDSFLNHDNCSSVQKIADSYLEAYLEVNR